MCSMNACRLLTAVAVDLTKTSWLSASRAAKNAFQTSVLTPKKLTGIFGERPSAAKKLEQHQLHISRHFC